MVNEAHSKDVTYNDHYDVKAAYTPTFDSVTYKCDLVMFFWPCMNMYSYPYLLCNTISQLGNTFARHLFESKRSFFTNLFM